MYLTFKAKITTNKRTEVILNNLCFSATKLYNTINWHLRSEWQYNRALCAYCDTIGYPHNGVKIPLNRTTVQSMFKDNHWAKNLHSQSAQFIVYEVINAYKSWFALRKNGHKDVKPPRFRPKTSFSPVTFLQKSVEILSTKNKHSCLRLSLGTKREDGIREITIRITHRNSLPQGTLKNVKITYDIVTGTYYAHLVFDVPATSKLGSATALSTGQIQLFPTNVVAVDLGLNNIITATFSDGTSCIISGRELKAIRLFTPFYKGGWGIGRKYELKSSHHQSLSVSRQDDTIKFVIKKQDRYAIDYISSPRRSLSYVRKAHRRLRLTVRRRA